MKHNLYIVTGAKGGVGKSLAAMALLDYLFDMSPLRQELIALAETDMTNPDVGKTYKKRINAQAECQLNDSFVFEQTFDERDNILKFFDFLQLMGQKGKNLSVVVNMPAGKTHDLLKYLREIQSALEGDLPFIFHHLWVMGNQYDCILLLKQHEEEIRSIGTLSILLNEYFAPVHRFEQFFNSETLRKIKSELQGDPVFVFPKLSQRVTDEIYSHRKTVEEVLNTSSYGNKLELLRWKNQVGHMFADLFQYIGV